METTKRQRKPRNNKHPVHHACVVNTCVSPLPVLHTSRLPTPGRVAHPIPPRMRRCAAVTSASHTRAARRWRGKHGSAIQTHGPCTPHAHTPALPMSCHRTSLHTAAPSRRQPHPHHAANTQPNAATATKRRTAVPRNGPMLPGTGSGRQCRRCHRAQHRCAVRR